MALRDQPYIPLYIQDILTDEKLIECSPASHGIYLRLMCILHKQNKYGLLTLKQKYKQSENKYICFASMLSKQMPFEAKQIQEGLEELHEEKVIDVTDNNLSQKRMVRDGELSLVRAEIGKMGGSNVTKQYGKSGYLYFMSDGYKANKIGISINPKNRLYRLRSDLKLPKTFSIVDLIEVPDMGKAEDNALEFFNDIRDGEWLKSDYKTCKDKFVLLKANTQANPQSNTENESEDENEDKSNIKEGVKKLKTSDLLRFEIDSTDITQSVVDDHMDDEQRKTRLLMLQSELVKPGFNLDNLMKAIDRNETVTVELIMSYIKHIGSTTEYCQPLSAIRHHCTNWIKIQLKKQENDKEKNGDRYSNRIRTMGQSGIDKERQHKPIH